MSSTPTVDAGAASALRRFVEHDWFKQGIIALIVLSAVLLGLETVRGLSPTALAWFAQANRVILGVFVVELALRITAHRGAFFRDPWSLFDLAVVGAAMVPSSSAVQVLRALRIVRALRLVSAVPSLRRVVDGLLSAVPGIASIGVLLVLLLYTAAVMATLLFRDVAPEYFAHLGVSLFTLFQIMTLEGWPDIARNVMASEPWAWVFFAGYILVATYMVLNLVIGVVVGAIQSKIEGENTGSSSELVKEIAELRREVAALRDKLDRNR